MLALLYWSCATAGESAFESECGGEDMGGRAVSAQPTLTSGCACCGSCPAGEIQADLFMIYYDLLLQWVNNAALTVASSDCLDKNV